MGLKHYDKTFKERAVKLSYERGNIFQVAKKLGIPDSQLGKWRRDYVSFYLVVVTLNLLLHNVVSCIIQKIGDNRYRFIVLCFCSGCVKLYEEVDLEIMKRPVIETDSIKPPDWDIHFPSH